MNSFNAEMVVRVCEGEMDAVRKLVIEIQKAQKVSKEEPTTEGELSHLLKQSIQLNISYACDKYRSAVRSLRGITDEELMPQVTELIEGVPADETLNDDTALFEYLTTI